MNCLEYRRRLLTDPRCSDAAVRQHAAGCATCSAWTEGRVRQEESLALALDVPVPANLADRILLDVQLRARRPRQWALAAMLMLAVCAAVGGWWLRLNAAPENWNAVVLAHVLAEPHTLTRDDAVPVARLQAALAEYALSADAPLGRIQYLDHCELPGGRGLHIVLRSPDAGQVSLIVPPPGISLRRQAPASRAGLSARMIAVGTASIGIVTTRHADGERVEAWLRSTLRMRRS